MGNPAGPLRPKWRPIARRAFLTLSRPFGPTIALEERCEGAPEGPPGGGGGGATTPGTLESTSPADSRGGPPLTPPPVGPAAPASPPVEAQGPPGDSPGDPGGRIRQEQTAAPQLRTAIVSAPDIPKLTEAAARGDRGAVDRLLELYLPELEAFVTRRAGRPLRAQESPADIVQSVCREVLQHADRFRHPSEVAFKQWLYTTALRKISARVDFYRAQKRDQGRVQDFAPGSVEGAASQVFNFYESFSTPSRHLMIQEEAARIEGAFALLSEEQREVVTLAHVLGLSRGEIAERIGKSEGAVRVILHRALARVSQLLTENSP
jgi:RNA polymerase sigma-70 factor (ECF subfamily)